MNIEETRQVRNRVDRTLSTFRKSDNRLLSVQHGISDLTANSEINSKNCDLVFCKEDGTLSYFGKSDGQLKLVEHGLLNPTSNSEGQLSNNVPDRTGSNPMPWGQTTADLAQEAAAERSRQRPSIEQQNRPLNFAGQSVGVVENAEPLETPDWGFGDESAPFQNQYAGFQANQDYSGLELNAAEAEPLPTEEWDWDDSATENTASGPALSGEEIEGIPTPDWGF